MTNNSNRLANVAFDIEDNDYNASENFADLFEDSVGEEGKEGCVVSGRVIAVDNDFVTIDVGLKSEGQVSIKEFSGGTKVPAVGDEVKVYVERVENREGKTILSHEKAIREAAWVQLEDSQDEGSTVDGVIFGRVKGGFTVDVQGVVAFLPGSQVDIRPIKDVAPLMGITQPFQILKMDRKQGNIVVSRRAILEESRLEARNELLSQISEGQVMEGIVKNITDYGAFIDLGSIDGLLHVTDISWSRISHPSEVLSLGQTLDVQIIKYNEETKRVSLGMKQLEANPWQGIEVKYPVSTKLKGEVTNITDYGAFIELETGIEGLVHVSEISWTKGNIHPRKLLTLGQEVDVVVLEVDSAKHRISLGMKQCEDNPWQNFASKNPIGTIIDGEIKNVVDFGLFIGFEDDIDGLVHVSDVSWSETPEEDLKNFAKDQNIQVKVLSVDVEKERISLGIKQLSDDPLEGTFSDIKKGQAVTCIVDSVADDGIEVSLFETSIKSFVRRSDLSRDRVEQRPDRFAVGDRVDAKITSFDKVTRKVGLSIKALEIDEHKRAIEEFGSSDSGASLGDILGAALDKKQEEVAVVDVTDSPKKKKADKKEAPAKAAAPAAEEEPTEEAALDNEVQSSDDTDNVEADK